MDPQQGHTRGWGLFLAGIVTGAAGLVLAQALSPRRRLDLRLLRLGRAEGVTPVVVVPGIMGSELLRRDGTPVWLGLRNALMHHDLGLPLEFPHPETDQDLVPGGLLGIDRLLPRIFGFREYSDLLELLQAAGFRRGLEAPKGPIYHVFTYDWRRDLVCAARRLHDRLEALAQAQGDPDARFNLVGHSMGGLVARYYLRYGTAEPDEDAPVTWAGARRIRNLVLIGVPSGGGVGALEGILLGNRVGLSTTTLAPSVVARMPSTYELLPPAGVAALVDARGNVLDADLHDIATWESFGWGPFAPRAARRGGDGARGDPEAQRTFLAAVLRRARAFHRALARRPATPCPARVAVLGGDCLATTARALVPERPGALPRFEAFNAAEADAMYEAGDGRVTRASMLGSHVDGAFEDERGCGLPEVSHVFLGHADHHGIYEEPSFQSVLLRLLLQQDRGRRPPVAA